MRFFIFVFFVCLSLSLQKTAFGKTVFIHYDEIPTYVKKQNKKVRSKNNLIDSKKAKTNYLKKSFLPEVTAAGGFETYKTGKLNSRTNPQFNITARVNLFRSGKDKLEDKIRNDLLKVAKLNFQNQYLKELTLARHLFATGIFYKKQIRLIKNSLHELKKLHQQAKQKQNSGLISTTEVNAIRLYTDQLKAKLILLQEDYEHTLDELKVTLGIDLSHQIKLNFPKQHSHLSFDQVAVQSHPQIQSLEKKIAISQKTLKKQKLWWAPSIDVYGSYGVHPFYKREYPNINDRDEYIVGVQLQMTLFDKMTISSKIKSEKYKTQALKNEKNHLEQNLKAIIAKLKHGIKVRHDLIHETQKILHFSNKNFAQLKIEFQNGIKNSDDILAAFENLIITNTKLLEYQRDHLMMQANLLALKGK